MTDVLYVGVAGRHPCYRGAWQACDMIGEGTTMAVFKKQGVYWVDYYVNGQRKRERIGPDKRLAETVLKKRKVEIAEEKFLDR